MLLLDFKLLLWIKHPLKPVSENHLAQCLTSTFLRDLWLAPLTQSVEKCAIEWFGFEGKMSHMLPLWFSFTWGGLDNLSYLSGGPVDHKTSFHISWRSLTICAACGPKVPVYLEELSSQQDSPSPAYSQFFTFLQASSNSFAIAGSAPNSAYVQQSPFDPFLSDSAYIQFSRCCKTQ